MKKRKYLWFLLLIIPISIFIVFMCLFCKDGNNAKWLELSLSTSGTIATIILGVMVYIQSERHKACADEDRKQDLLIKTAPYLAFSEIEYAQSAKNHTVVITELSPDCVRYIDDEECNEAEEEFIRKYNHGQLFRFIFHCPAEKGLNNIVFREVSVYPQYPDDENGRVEKQYHFLNKKGKTDYVNLSFLGNNRYQVCKYFMFPNDKDSYFCSLAQQFENDLLNEGKQIFFNINYIATNIYGVKISGELKFFASALLSPEKDKIIFTEPTNLSNWLDNPELIDKEKTNELNA